MDIQINHPNEFPRYKDKVLDALSRDSSQVNIKKIHTTVLEHSKNANGDTKTLLDGLAKQLSEEITS